MALCSSSPSSISSSIYRVTVLTAVRHKCRFGRKPNAPVSSVSSFRAGLLQYLCACYILRVNGLIVPTTEVCCLELFVRRIIGRFETCGWITSHFVSFGMRIIQLNQQRYVCRRSITYHTSYVPHSIATWAARNRQRNAQAHV